MVEEQLNIDNEDVIKLCIDEHLSKKGTYDNIFSYYIGNTDAMKRYKELKNRSNNKAPVNFIKKFVKDETSYILSNPIEYLSKTSNNNIVDEINKNLAHWSAKHDKTLGTESILYGHAYELYFSDREGRFSSLIISPRNSYIYQDEYGNTEFFLYFFNKKFDDKIYVDIYYPFRVVNCYLEDSKLVKIGEGTHIFDEVPVSPCIVSSVDFYDTLYNDLKGLQDMFEWNNNDLSNEISDWRNAVLKLKNCKIKDEQIPQINEQGILELPSKDSEAEWLIKRLENGLLDTFLKFTKENIYEVSCHINNNEKLSSNTSSLTLKTKLHGLTNKILLNRDGITDCIKGRLKFLFKYLQYKENKSFDYLDIIPKYTLSIPQDDLLMAQIFSQLQNIELFSKDTMRSQFSFIVNAKDEGKKVDKENDGTNTGKKLLDNTGDDDEVI